MIADSWGSREIKVDILELLPKVKETECLPLFSVLFFFFCVFLPLFLEEHMKGLRKSIKKN